MYLMTRVWHRCGSSPRPWFHASLAGFSIFKDFIFPLEVFPIDPEINIRGDHPSKAHPGELPQKRSAAPFHEDALCVLRAFADDIDHAVYRVRPQSVPPGPLTTSMRLMSSRR